MMEQSFVRSAYAAARRSFRLLFCTCFCGAFVSVACAGAVPGGSSTQPAGAVVSSANTPQSASPPGSSSPDHDPSALEAAKNNVKTGCPCGGTPDRLGIASETVASMGGQKPDKYDGATFPPADFAPPFERSAMVGDGVWVRMGDAAANERAAQSPAVIYKTTVHPHAISKFIKVTIAAIDLKNTLVRWVPGTQDPVPAALLSSESARSSGFAAGLVPKQDQANLLLVHNGGFKPQHGGWGMKTFGIELVPPREQGCTIVMTGDDVLMGSWPDVQEKAQKAPAFRQTPPCLIDRGDLHEQLVKGNLRPWGGMAKDVVTRRRTALGLDKSGRILFFAMGEEADPHLLAQAMMHAGAHYGAQLDINWNWTRFLLFGGSEDELVITSTLVPEMVHRKRGYVQLTQDRDFFYITRRD